MQKRIESIDIIRGIAVLQMIFWQIYDFFSKADIYQQSNPLFFKPFNSPINGIGLILFAFISGASIFLSVDKRQYYGKKNIIFNSIKRYGSYILISLLFTTFVFGFNVFYRWNEAIQGIGIAALIATILVLFAKSKWFYLIFGMALSFVQPLIRQYFYSDFYASNFPLEPGNFSLFTASMSMLLNMTVRGYFSITHVLPPMLFGVFLAILIKEFNNRKKVLKFSSIFAGFFFLIGIIMHILGVKVDVYLWSPSYQILFTSFSVILYMLSEIVLLHFGVSQLTEFFSVFGKLAVIPYIGHFLLIKKPMELLGLENTFSFLPSILFAIVFVAAFYYINKLVLRLAR